MRTLNFIFLIWMFSFANFSEAQIKKLQVNLIPDNLSFIRFSPDNKTFAAASSNKLYIYNNQHKKLLRCIETDDKSIHFIEADYSFDGKYILTNTENRIRKSSGEIKVWEVSSGKLINTLPYEHIHALFSKTNYEVYFKKKIRLPLTTIYDYNTKIWDFKQNIIKEGEFKGGIMNCSHDGRYLITYRAGEPEIRVYDAKSKNELYYRKIKLIIDDYSKIYPLHMINDKLVFTAIEDNYKQVIVSVNINTNKSTKLLDIPSSIKKISTSLNGKYLLLDSYEKLLLVETSTMQTIKEWTFPLDSWREGNKPIRPSFSQNSNYLLFGKETYELSTRTTEKLFSDFNVEEKTGQLLNKRTISFDNKLLEEILGQTILKEIFGKDRRCNDANVIENAGIIQSSTFMKTFIEPTISNDCEYIVHRSKLYDAQTKKVLLKYKIPAPFQSAFNSSGSLVAIGNMYGGVKLFNRTQNKSIKTLKESKGLSTITSVSFSPCDEYLIATEWNKPTKVWNIKTGQLEYEFVNLPNANMTANKKYLYSKNNNRIDLWNLKTKKNDLSLFLFPETGDWLVTKPDGRFDGTEKAMDLIYYADGNNIIPLSSYFEQFYTPNLAKRIFEGEKFKEPEIRFVKLKLPPLVKITSPIKQGDLRGVTPFGNSQLKSTVKEIQVKVKAIDEGGGIDEIRLYVNGKLVDATTRGLKLKESENKDKTKTFTVELVSGINQIKASAFNMQRTESLGDEINILYEGAKKTANLHVLVIGIDKYENPKYNLNYALADATAFKQKIEKGSGSIFGNVNTILIKNKEATKENILNKFKQLKTEIGQEDVLVFYYAGHGVMSEEKKAQFYIVPHDVTQLYGNNEMLKSKAISATELQELSKNIKAQKQMFVLDACQSGGMVEMIASRGAVEEKAIAQLARSTGTYWLAASNSEQFATEFKDLGHGVFTYAILEGLKGHADGGKKDKKITVKELSAFLNDKVPELSEKHKGSAQYPTSYGFGQDFPIIIVK